MKTYKKIVDIAISDEIIEDALKTACVKKLERPEVQEVLKRKDFLKRKIQDLISGGNLKPILHAAHEINDGFKRKVRIIIQPYFTPKKPEQWLHHILIHTLKPILMHGMYEFSCGSIPDRGIHYGKKYLEKFIEKNPKEIKYVLKLDIKHFYENVNTELLKQRFREKIKDELMLKFIYFVLDSNVGVFEDGRRYAKGLPIGFYTSQWFANWFLQPFDHYVKETLKAPFYMRYMDDIVIFSSNKRALHKMFKAIVEYLGSIDLSVKENWQIFLFDYTDKDGKRHGRPIDYMGFKFYRDKTTIRKAIFLRACRLARRISKQLKISWRDACQILSYMGWFYPTKTYNAYKKHIAPKVNIQKCKKIVSKHNKNKLGGKNGNKVAKCSKQRKTVGN